MAFTQKLFTSYHGYSDGDTRIGEKNRIWYDSNTNTLRIQLDNTPGGTIIGGGGSGNYTLPTATASVLGGVKIGSNITINSGVISVAAPFSGSYNDLTNKPTIPSLTGYATETFVTTRGYLTSVGTISYNDLSNKPSLFSGSYTDLTNKPTLFDGAYASLSGKPSLFSGSYTDLTNKPTIYSSAYIGTTSLDFTRSSASQTLNGVSIDGSILWVNPTPAPGDPYRTAISAASGSAGISLSTGLPGLGSTVNWTFDTTKITFPDTTTQTTAYTGNADTATKLATARNINGVAFDGSTAITVTAAAGTLTGTTLNSTVVSSSLTSVGTLSSLAVTNSSATPLTVTYTPATRTGQAIQATGKDTQGGTGYFDFLRATNTTSGATNPNKTFRLNSTGACEIINSAYNATLMSLSDTGFMSTARPYQVAGKQAVNGPAFRAFVSVGQTITSGSQQKVTFGGETFDTDNCFGDSTYTFTPTLEGYYQFNATIRISGTAGTGEVMLVLYKNGSEYSRGTNESGTEQGANFYSMQISDIAYANGTTDNFELYIQQTSGASRTTTAGSAISHFSGVMIRGA